MTPSEIAAQFDDRMGYSVVSYGEVGLPIFSIVSVGLVQQLKSLNAVEEFVIRTVKNGLNSQKMIAQFLGLDEEIVSRSLVDLAHQSLVTTSVDHTGRVFGLTKDGELAAQENQLSRPQETILTFTYDGLTRRPKYVEASNLIAPRFLPELGLAEIPAMPNRGPIESELNVLDVERVIASSDRFKEIDGKLLKVKRVERRTRMFLPAVAITYKDDLSGTYRIGFAIEGRMSEEHELAFAKARGIERVSMFSELANPVSPPPMETIVGSKIAKELASISKSFKPKRDTARARAIVGVAKIRVQLADDEFERARSESELRAAQSVLSKSEEDLKKHTVRPLPVYEHPPLLAHALQNSKLHLLIVSPWIRSAVVDRLFIQQLVGLLEKGVIVHIGYGLGEDDLGARPDDLKVESQLAELAKKYPTFTFRRLGDTHAKVLVVDEEFFVITSFNWLSFRGDSNRPFREEWGTFIGVRDKTADFYRQMLKRFSDLPK